MGTVSNRERAGKLGGNVLEEGAKRASACDELLVPSFDGVPFPRNNVTTKVRDGFTFNGPSMVGQSVIARLDTTGEEPKGSVSRDAGETWEGLAADSTDSPGQGSAKQRRPGVPTVEIARPDFTFRPNPDDPRWGSDAMGTAVCRESHSISVVVCGQRIEVAACAGDTAAMLAQAVAARLGGRYEARGSTVVERPQQVISGGATAFQSQSAGCHHVDNRGAAPSLPLILAEDLPARRTDPVHVLFTAEVNPADNGVWIVWPNGSRERPSTDDLKQPVQPNPAPTQVWLPPLAACFGSLTAPDGTVTIRASHAHETSFVEGGAMRTRAITATGGWTCVGVATPNGRVMAGDGFGAHSGAHLVTVVAVTDQANARVVFRDKTTAIWGALQLAVLPRTRYAPARAGERYRDRATGQVIRCVDTTRDPSLPGEAWAFAVGAQPDPAQWERLDPGMVVGENEPATATPSPHVDIGADGKARRDIEKGELVTMALAPRPNARAQPAPAAEQVWVNSFDNASVTERYTLTRTIDRAPERWATEEGPTVLTTTLVAQCRYVGTKQETIDAGASVARDAIITEVVPSSGDSDLRFECRTCGKPIEYEGACSKKCGKVGAPYTYGRRDGDPLTVYQHTQAELDKRDLAITSDPRDTLVVGKLSDISTLTFPACAASLRALHDAIGQALEVGTGHVAAFGDGRWGGAPLVVRHDEVLFTPELTMDAGPDGTALPAAVTIAADAKHLLVLRQAVAEATETGKAAPRDWGKGRRLAVERVEDSAR